MYKRFPKEVTVYTSGVTFTDSDDFRVNEPFATNTLYDFEHERAVVRANGGYLLIPFHAIDHITVETSVEEYDKADPYGCADPNGLTTENGTEITDENDNPIISG